MTYKVAQGNVNPSLMNDVDPQPKSDGINDGVPKVLGHGGVEFDGFKSVEWEYTVLTEEQMDDLLTAFNLVDNANYPVTISTRENNDRSFTNYYGRVSRPKFEADAKANYGLWKGVVFKITKLQEVS